MLTNKFNLPEALYQAVANDPYNSGDCDISTTRLIAPPQQVALQARYRDSLVEDVSDRIWSLIGQCVHGILERAAEGSGNLIAEKRYTADVKGWKLSGAIDLYDKATKTLYDYKVTSTTKVIFGDFEEYEKQGNINRWLMAQNGEEVERLHNVLILRDWVQSKVGTRNYPPVQVVEVPLGVWTIEEAKAYVEERVALHQKARAMSDEELAQKMACTEDDRWKNDVRCKKYCSVSTQCVQYKNSI